MSRRRIIASGEEAALLLPPETLDKMGLSIGDEVDLSVEDGALVVRPLNESTRAQRIEEVTGEVFERRQNAYRRLAEGVE